MSPYWTTIVEGVVKTIGRIYHFAYFQPIMKLKYWLAVCFCLFLVSESFAQVYYIDSRVYNGNERLSMQEGINFSIYPYQGTLLDLKAFQLQNPLVAAEIPEYVEIAPPENVDLNDAAYGVAYIGIREGTDGDWRMDDDAQQGWLILMLITDYSTPHPSFYIDNNMNRAFLDDEDPIRFKRKNQHARVLLTNPETEKEFEFYLVAPKELRMMVEAEGEDKEKADESNARPFSPRKLWLGFGLHAGNAMLDYKYSLLTTGYPVTYEVSSTTKGVNLSFHYRWKNLQIGAYGGLEHIFYWSSVKTTRLGEPYTVCTPDGCVNVSNIRVDINRDRHPRLRFQTGLELSYAIPFGKFLSMGPVFNAAMLNYNPAAYVPDYAHPEVSYDIAPTGSIEAGLLIRLNAGHREAFQIMATAYRTGFNPQGYFEEIDLAGLQVTNRGFRVQLVYLFGL